MLMSHISFQENYLHEFVNSKTNVINKKKYHDRWCYFIECPKCKQKSSISQSRKGDTYLFHCYGTCQFPTQRGLSSTTTLHTLIKNHGGSDLFQRWCEGVYPNWNQNKHPMYRMKKEIKEKTFKEKLQMKSEFLLNVYFPNWKKKNPEFV